ncbi:MAG: abc-f [Herbinix sp.]|jgi:ATPase subunit of ABC transporter with duplicated ATPase domains|nr:abc-f [Herbinix sp.]
MIELSIDNLMKFYGANKIFENISFDIKTGEHIGLIGRNGCGKTSILKILMGLEEHQAGNISIRKDCKLGYLNQIPEYAEEATVMDVVQMAFKNIYELHAKMDELEQQMIYLKEQELEKAILKYSRLQEQYELGEGYELETKINKITEGLKITENLKQMLFNSLSGGEKTRVILAKLLLEEPDILLLDEPTNHLDLNTIMWLESFLKDYKGAALIISHDRFFLDNVVSRVIELNSDQAEEYLGNYSYYVTEKERRFLIAQKEYQNQQKKIDRMEQQIERFRIWGAMRDSEVMYKRAKEIEKRLEKIDVLDRPILSKRKIRLNQTEVGRSGKIVIEAVNLKKSFGERLLFQDAKINVFYQDSVCIIGENGCGKTTLLKLLLGEIEPDGGTVKLGSQVIIGYLPQQVDFKNEDQTVLEYFSRLHNLTYGDARSQLAKVLFFNEDVNKSIKFLSGGEKSRLKLCSLTFEGVNLLILDEPTNHLDIESREVLEETLLNFSGTLLFVSHDRYFIDKMADKIIEIENLTTKEYNGDYEYYQEEVKKLQEKQSMVQNNSVKLQDSNNLNKQTSTSNLFLEPKNSKSKNTRKLELLEKSIEEIEEKIRTLEVMIEANSSNFTRLKELLEEKEEASRELEKVYIEWFEHNQA